MKNNLKEAVFAAFLAFLRPTAKLLLRCGITWKELAELTKLALVAAAAEEFGAHGRSASTSRIALATGLGRREVKRVRDLLDAPKLTRASTALGTVNHASRILTGWHRDPDFRTASGRPRLLLPGGESGFEELARRYAPDIPPVAILRELKQVGAVAETPGGKLRAVSRYYMPSQLDTQSVVRSGDVLADFSRTVVHNLTAQSGATRFEARATNAWVRRRAAGAFQAYLELNALQFLQDADDWLAEREGDQDEEAVVRLGVGVYMIRGEPG